MAPERSTPQMPAPRGYKYVALRPDVYDLVERFMHERGLRSRNQAVQVALEEARGAA